MSQCELLLKIMRDSGHVSKRVADTYRIENLKGRICDLRDRGYRIKTEFARDAMGKKYARYSLDEITGVKV